jgi:hypothetical protein
MRGVRAALVIGLLAACQQARPVAEERPPVPTARSSPGAPPTAAAPASSARPAPDPARYPWLGAAGVPEPVDSLSERFSTPAGFTRQPLEPESFGAWLRDLPLTHPGAPVRAFDGSLLLPGTDRRIAAVAAIDVGKADLQQCADAVMRLHAEWSWSRGRRDASYRAASGLMLPFERWARGERIRASGASIAWVAGGARASDHAAYRKYLDTVFAWANTVSLEKQARRVEAAEIRAGDFFILPGNPGHTVLVLDLARSGDRSLALLGQSFMPAQSFQVLRPRADAVWFELDPARDVATPFWRPFPWTSLRRLD